MGLHPMSAVSPKPGSGGAVSAAAALGSKARKAAEQFEAVLLQSLLEPLEKSFSTLPGKDDLSGADNYHYLGTQALASALAQSGGLGMAGMMVRNLLKTNNVPAKAPGAFADKTR